MMYCMGTWFFLLRYLSALLRIRMFPIYKRTKKHLVHLVNCEAMRTPNTSPYATKQSYSLRLCTDQTNTSALYTIVLFIHVMSFAQMLTSSSTSQKVDAVYKYPYTQITCLSYPSVPWFTFKEYRASSQLAQ
jgi:hypothetical protein